MDALSHKDLLSRSLSLNHFSPALPPLASSCQYITTNPQQHVLEGVHDCHIPQRSSYFELLFIFCWLYWLLEFWVCFAREDLCTYLKEYLIVHKACHDTHCKPYILFYFIKF